MMDETVAEETLEQMDIDSGGMEGWSNIDEGNREMIVEDVDAGQVQDEYQDGRNVRDWRGEVNLMSLALRVM